MADQGPAIEPPADDELRRLAEENARLRAALSRAEQERATARRFLDTPAIGLTYLRRDGAIVSINERGARNLGGTPEQLEGMSLFELVPELADQTRARIAQTLDTGQALSVETTLTLPTGQRIYRSTYYPAHDAGEHGELVQLVSQDITELKHMERALQATEGRLAVILEHAPHIIAILEADGVVRYVSRYPTGYDASQVLGTELSRHVSPEHAEPIAQALRATCDTRRPQRLEFTDLLDRAWELHLAPVIAEGEVQQVIAFVLDITERASARERERELEAQVQHAQKLESLGVLAGGIAHDFNNLLVGILGNAQLALRDPTAALAAEHLNGIISASQRAAELCRQMLAYAGRGQLSLGAVDVSALSLEILDLVSASISKRARVKSDCPKGLPRVEGDAGQLRQVVMNLLTNAAEALLGGEGEITLRCGLTEQPDTRPATFSHLPETPTDGPHVFVEVTDTGCGMDVETCQRMFDPFFTSKELGSGLGLAAVLGIVRRHHGSIRVHSELGRGTRVVVRLPAGAQDKPASEVPQREGPKPGRTILVADDEPMVRNVVKQMLEQEGHEVLLAKDGEEALRIYDSDPRVIDAALLDLSMPRMDGRQTLRQLRERDPNLPIILASGFSSEADDPRDRKAGVLFIVKPYDLSALLSTLGRALTSTRG